MEIARTMAFGGYLQAGYRYLILDDCWQNANRSYGALYADPSRFPEGMYLLVDDVKLDTYKYIFLLTFFETFNKISLTRTHRVFFLLSFLLQIHNLGLKVGIFSDLGDWSGGGFPGSHNHFDLDARTFRSWNVDYVKMSAASANKYRLNKGVMLF